MMAIKEALRKYWIHLVLLLAINIPIIVICSIRTNYSLILKGDTSPFDSVVEIDTDNKEEGSFSTIFVISMDNSTVFQNILADHLNHIEKNEMNEFTSHMSYQESYEAGKIQYHSSIAKALILAYNEAKKKDPSINIDYKLNSLKVTYYNEGGPFRVGDEIIKIGALSASDPGFLEGYRRELVIGNECVFIRDGKSYTHTFKEGDSFAAELDYEINYETINPSVKFHDNAVGGPSGGLLQALSIYNRLTKEDITHGLKIAGTGTIDIDGKVGPIGGIKEKIPTAFKDDVSIFLCAKDNYADALLAYNLIPNHERMRLVKIDTFYDALDYLLEGYKNDF